MNKRSIKKKHDRKKHGKSATVKKLPIKHRNMDYKPKKKTLRKKMKGGSSDYNSLLLGLLDEKYITIPTTRCLKDDKSLNIFFNSVTGLELFTLIGKKDEYVNSNTLNTLISDIDYKTKEIFKQLGSLTKSPAATKLMSNFRVNCFNLTSESTKNSSGYMKELHSYILECENHISLKDVDWYQIVLGLRPLDIEFDTDILNEMRERGIMVDTDKFKYGLDILKNDDEVREICKKRIIECGNEPRSFMDRITGSVSWNSYNRCFKCKDSGCVVQLDDNYKSFLKKKHNILTVDKIKILIFMELRLRKISKYFSAACIRLKDRRFSKVSKLLRKIYNDDIAKGNVGNYNDKQLIMPISERNQLVTQKGGDDTKLKEAELTKLSEGESIDASGKVSNSELEDNLKMSEFRPEDEEISEGGKIPGGIDSVNVESGNFGQESEPIIPKDVEVGPSDVRSEGIESGDVGSEGIGSGDVGPGSVGPGSIGPGSVGPGSIESGDVGPGSIESGDVGPGSIESGDVGPGSIGSGDVVPGSVGSGDVVPGSVGSGDVVPGSVGPGSIGPGDVGPGSVGPGSIGPGDVGPGSVEPGSIGSEEAKSEGAKSEEAKAEKSDVKSEETKPEKVKTEGEVKTDGEVTNVEPLSEKPVEFSKMFYISYNGIIKSDKVSDSISKQVTNSLREVCKLTNKDRLKVYRVRIGPRTVSIEIGIEDSVGEELTDEEIKSNIVKSIVDKEFSNKMVVVELDTVKDIYFDGISKFEELKDYPSQHKRVLIEMDGKYPKSESERVPFETKILNDIKEFLEEPDLDLNRIQLENITDVPKKEDKVFVQFVIMNGIYEKKTPHEIIKAFKEKYEVDDGNNEFTKKYNIENAVFGEPSVILDNEDIEKMKSMSQEKDEFYKIDRSTFDKLESDYKRVAYFGCDKAVKDISSNVIMANTPLSKECEEDINKIVRGY